jgi:hypothetical protein
MYHKVLAEGDPPSLIGLSVCNVSGAAAQPHAASANSC